MSEERGVLVVVEGPDAVGKTEVVKELARRFESRRTVMRFAFPSSGPVGKLIRQTLNREVPVSQDALLHLYAADGIDNEQRVIDSLERGCLVLMDRAPTLGSAWVYQSDRHPLTRITSIMDNDVRPDMVFILDAPADVAQKRLASRSTRDMFEEQLMDTHRYEVLRSRYAAFAIMCGAYTVDATQPLPVIVDEMERVILQHYQTQEGL